MKLSEFMAVIKNHIRLRIYREGEDVPVLTTYSLALKFPNKREIEEGVFEILKEDPEVVRFFACPEIRHRMWEERGLLPPYEPEITRQYEFADLTILMYYNVYVKGGGEDGR